MLLGVPQKECGKRSSITFFRFRDTFGHFSVTFPDASVTFFVTFFAKLLLPDSFCGRVSFFSGVRPPICSAFTASPRLKSRFTSGTEGITTFGGVRTRTPAGSLGSARGKKEHDVHVPVASAPLPEVRRSSPHRPSHLSTPKLASEKGTYKLYRVKPCNGQIIGQPRKRECRQNVRKNVERVSEKCPKIVRRGRKRNFWTFF